MLKNLRDQCNSREAILEQVQYRVDWIKYQESQKRKEEEEIERDRGIITHVTLYPILSITEDNTLC